MLTERNVDNSVVARLVALFTAPPNSFTNPFHVYFEDSYHDPLFVTEPPALWLVKKNVRPTKARLPLLILKRGPFGWLPFEVGNREGQLGSYTLLIFGRTDGEASDLASFVKRNLDPLPIYDFDETPKTLLYYAHLNNIASVPMDVGGELGIEGALANQENLFFDFAIKEL